MNGKIINGPRAFQHTNRLFRIFGCLLAALLASTQAATAQLFITNTNAGVINEYTPSGTPVATPFATEHSPSVITSSGNDLFVGDSLDRVVEEYSTSGTRLSSGLVGVSSGYVIGGIAVSGNDLYMSVYSSGAGFLAEFTLGSSDSYTTLASLSYAPGKIAVSGNDIFVPDYSANSIAEYTTSGTLVSSSFITGLNSGPEDIAVAGGDLFIANFSGTIAEYTLSGTLVTSSLLSSGLSTPFALTASGNDLYVLSNYGNATLGEYTTSGATVNATLLTKMGNVQDLTVAGPEPTSWVLLLLGAISWAGFRHAARVLV